MSSDSNDSARSRDERGQYVSDVNLGDADEHLYLGGDGALADTDVPEQMQDERERAREEWADNGSTESHSSPLC